MTAVTQPLREEHKELFPHIESLRKAAEAMNNTPDTETYRLIQEAERFLVNHLIPHAEAEEQALYPVVQKMMGAPEATLTMSRDHIEIGRLTEELENLLSRNEVGQLDSKSVDELRQILYGLYTLVKVHFAKEEEVYLPLLDSRLSQEEARQLFENMEAAAHNAKSHLSE